jgi:hypothetical protein
MKLNRFIVNSDYTAAKMKGRYTISLSVPSKSIPDGSTAYRYTATVDVPQGTYFENVSISSSLTSGKFAGNSVGIDVNGNWTAYLAVYQSSPTKYTLACTLNGYQATTTAFTANAIIDLAISPF